MFPSRNHELDKENIGRLLEAYLEEKRIRFRGLGSTTFRREDRQDRVITTFLIPNPCHNINNKVNKI